MSSQQGLTRGEPAATQGQVERVRRFYDRNTGRFRRLGEGGAAIHRAVWGPGCATRDQAFRHVEEFVLSLIADIDAPRVVDLGCGLGASLVHLASRRADLAGAGVTISPVQVATAATLIEQAGVDDRVQVREGDFLAPPPDLAGADLVFSIEAFVHASDPAAYFRAATTLVRPGGLLVICDDVLTEAGARPSAAQARWLDRFRAGWRIGTLLTAEEAVSLANGAGLEPVRDDDLTAYLELRRLRDRWVRLLVTATRPLRLRGEYIRSLAGGDALQRCLADGLIGYRLLVFRRSGLGAPGLTP